MKAMIAWIPALLLLAGCKDKNGQAGAPAKGSPDPSAVAVVDAPPVLEDVRSLAKVYLANVKAEAIDTFQAADARRTLSEQRTPGAASLKEIEYKKAREDLDKSRDEKYESRDELVEAEEALQEPRKEGRHSDAIEAFEKKAIERYREYRLAESREIEDAAHKKWMAYLETTFEQIEAGDY